MWMKVDLTTRTPSRLQRKGVRTPLALAAVGLVIAVSGCSLSALPEDPGVISPSSSSTATVAAPVDEGKVTGLVLTQSSGVGNPALMIPEQWTPSRVPGAQNAYTVTTAPGGFAMGVTQLNGETIAVTKAMLEDITQAAGGKTETALVLSDRLGYIQIPQKNGGGVIEGWVTVQPTSGTYLITLGPAPTPDEVVSPATGTASEQMLHILNVWLGI
jgi:hypothetical protein